MNIRKVLSGIIVGCFTVVSMMITPVTAEAYTQGTSSGWESSKDERGHIGGYYHHGGYGVYYETEKEFMNDFGEYYKPETDHDCVYKDGVLYSYDYENKSYIVDRYVLKGTSVTIPKKIGDYFVVAIGDNAFMNCKTLKTVKLPETLKYIGANAFGNCTNLTSVNFPNNLQKLSVDYSGKYNDSF